MSAEIQDRSGSGAPVADWVALGPVEVRSSAEVFADVLRERILTGEIPAGSALPPERVLTEQSGLSRAVVRDGLRELKHQGLIRTSPGRHGGSVVSRPTAEDLSRSLGTFVLANGLAGAPELRETREVIEPWCAAFAAARRSDDDLERIDAAHRHAREVVDDYNDYVRASQCWHIAVSDAGHHPLLGAIMHVQLDDQIRAARTARNSSMDLRRSALESHAAIAEAIRHHDPKEAFRLMAIHCMDGPARLLDRLESEGSPLGGN